MNGFFKKNDLLVAGLISALLIFFTLNPIHPLEALEGIFYSVRMRLDLPRTLLTPKVAIVNIDEKSIQQLGPWPWPRALIAEMIQILKDNGAKAVALDFILSQRERNPGLAHIRALKQEISAGGLLGPGQEGLKANIIRRLKKIERDLDNDKILIETVKKCSNVVLPMAGKFGYHGTQLIPAAQAYVVKNSLPITGIDKEIRDQISVVQLTLPFPELAKNARGLGHINLPPQKALWGKAHLPFINYGGHIFPSLPLALYFHYAGRRPASVTIENSRIILGQKEIPTAGGVIFFKFKGARLSFPNYSFVDILKVRKVPAVFEDKIVLIGYTAEEGLSSLWTPVDPEMPRVEFLANILESLMTGRYVKRPTWILAAELLLILVAAFGAALLMPRVPFFPRFLMAGGGMLLVFLASIIFFVTFSIHLKIVYILMGLFSMFLYTSIKELVLTEKTMEVASKESIETNRMLGLSFQSQGLLDLAFEKFRKCPLDDSMKDVLYNLALDFERKRMPNKAISVYEYILTEGGENYRDAAARMEKLRKLTGERSLGLRKEKREAKILISEDLGIRPTVGRYEILEEIGQGAMGMVYKARDPKINRTVAIKTIRFADEFDQDKIQEVKERFMREAELAGKLSHPAIISIYDVGEDYDLTYMAMELLEGKDLEHFCHRDALLPVRKVLDIIGEVAEALDYAHRQGVIHRDIKPANIMLLNDGRVKVTDFGIAKAISSSQTKSGVILGTPNYMSPEQINGQPIDGRSDIFSLGVVFFQLLTGRLPFKGRTLTELFVQITQKPHPSVRELNPKVPKPCEQLIDKALAKDPERRFQTGGEFARYIRKVAEKMDELRAKRMNL